MASVFVPPYDKAGQPVGPPVTSVAPVFPLNTATTRQLAAALANVGHLQLAVDGDVSIFVGAGDAATGAAPFFIACFEVPSTQAYTFTFEFDYDFNVRLDGGLIGLWNLRGVRTSMAVTRAIAEVFDKNGNLIKDGWMSPYQDWKIFRSFRGRIRNKGKLSFIAQLQKTISYYWKFTFLASVNASVRTIVPADATCEVLAMPAVAGGGKAPAPPPGAGAAAGMFLRTVTVNPNVAPFPCPP